MKPVPRSRLGIARAGGAFRTVPVLVAQDRRRAVRDLDGVAVRRDAGLRRIAALAREVADHPSGDGERGVRLGAAARHLHVGVGRRGDEPGESFERGVDEMREVRGVRAAAVVVDREFGLSRLRGERVELLPVPVLEVVDRPPLVQHQRFAGRGLHDLAVLVERERFAAPVHLDRLAPRHHRRTRGQRNHHQLLHLVLPFFVWLEHESYTALHTSLFTIPYSP